jgi:hypothetical protein
MDGPDFHKLFTGMKTLNAETNLKEICQYLRFSKDEGAMYQTYLAHYLPMLPEKEFNEFIGDLTVGGEELKKRFIKEEVKVETIEEEKNKPGRPKTVTTVPPVL